MGPNVVVRAAQRCGSILCMLGIGGIQIDDDMLAAITVSSPGINHLGIGGINTITTLGFDVIAQNLPSLTSLNAHGMGHKSITNSVVDNLLSKAPQIRSLDLAGCDHLTQHEIQRFH